MMRESEMCHSSDPHGKAHADCERRKGHDGLCYAFGQTWTPDEHVNVYEFTAEEQHLIAAHTLLATEDECVQLGPWMVERERGPWMVKGGVIPDRYYVWVGTFLPFHPEQRYLFGNLEDARAVCAALNRNARVRVLNAR